MSTAEKRGMLGYAWGNEESWKARPGALNNRYNKLAYATNNASEKGKKEAVL